MANNQEKIKEITEKLHKGIQELFESERYKEFLSTMAKFTNYSFNNTVLIALQRPDAEAVAGYKTWERKFNRRVVEGAKGIAIIQPAPWRKKTMETETDANGNPVYDENGQERKKEVEQIVEGYKVGFVYSLTDTIGPPLPSIVTNLKGTLPNYEEFIDVLKKVSPVPIIFEPIKGSTNGYYHLETRDIHVDSDLSEAHKAKTCVHEVGHSLLHDKIDGEDQEANRFEREVCAESVAYTVMSYYGLDTSSFSFGYILGYSSTKELKELQSKMELIRKTANKIITEMDAEFLRRKMVQADELTFKNGMGYLCVQKTDNGYDYSFYDQNFNLVDGGQYDNLDLNIVQATTDIMKSLDIDPDTMILQDTESVLEKVAEAEKRTIEMAENNEEHEEMESKKIKPSISHKR